MDGIEYGQRIVVYIPLIKLRGILPETLFALFASECLSQSDSKYQFLQYCRNESIHGEKLRNERTISLDFFNGCVSCSAWHSAQSNHFRPMGLRIYIRFGIRCRYYRIGLRVKGIDLRLGLCSVDSQHGARMATWALRTCLLWDKWLDFFRFPYFSGNVGEE